MKIIIPRKLPSLNEYINACRSNKYQGNIMKGQVQQEIGWYIKPLPKLKTPIIIHFTWQEKNKKRDLDNIAFAKKFILDSLVIQQKIPDDSAKFVRGYTDSFKYGDDYNVTVEIEEIKDDS